MTSLHTLQAMGDVLQYIKFQLNRLFGLVDTRFQKVHL